MLRVGLTGGLACGKTFVAKALGDLGCHIIQADELGHRVLLPGGEAYAPVVAEFGKEILGPDGTVDRRKLGDIVFQTPEKLAKLSSIVHPAVRRLERSITNGILKTEPDAIIVVEAAILVETGSYREFDRLIVVVCKPEQQVERAMHRDAYTKEEALARIGRQLTSEEKKRVAHYVVDTSESQENTLEQTRDVYNSLRSIVR